MGVMLVILLIFPNNKVVEKRYPLRTMTECLTVLHETEVSLPRMPEKIGYFKTCSYRWKQFKKKKTKKVKVKK